MTRHYSSLKRANDDIVGAVSVVRDHIHDSIGGSAHASMHTCGQQSFLWRATNVSPPIAVAEP